MTPKISELSTLKMEKERAYEDQLKSQIKWLSQLKWNWANNRDKNNEKFFYYFFDFCFQNFEMSLTPNPNPYDIRLNILYDIRYRRTFNNDDI